MRILFLSELFYPHGGGAELASYLYAKFLAEKGSDVVVITNRFGEEPAYSINDHLTTYRLDLFGANSSVKYSIFKRFDILLSSFMRKMIDWADLVYIPRFWYSAIPYVKSLGKPVITHLHDYFPICSLSNSFDMSQKSVCTKNLSCSQKCIYAYEITQGRSSTQVLTSMVLNSTLGRFVGKLVRFSDAIICVSKKHREVIVEQENSLAKKTSVVYNPLPLISDVELQGDDFGFFGGPNYLKGFHVLTKSLKQINETKPKSVKVHCTKFSGLDRKIGDCLTKIGISPIGKLVEDDYMNLYKKIKAVIVPSVWHEPWPYVVVEAIVRGRFVIASRIGGMPEQFEGCKNVIFCEPGNSRQLAEAIGVVSDMKRDEIFEAGMKDKKNFNMNFNNAKSIRDFTNICENLIH